VKSSRESAKIVFNVLHKVTHTSEAEENMSPKSTAKKSKKTANTKSKKSQDKKSAKAVEEDASELRLLEVAREMETSGTQREGTPLWYRVVMFSLVALGILWIIAYYIFEGRLPVPGIGMWNVTIGVGAMMVGMVMMTRWR